MPKISVILSAYNAEKFIAQSIESVLNQKFKDFEFLIIEDHSTDGTLQIIESYASEDSRINLVKKDKNKGFEGYVENLNLMIDQARGKYIAKFDADDIWSEDKLEKQLMDIESHPDIFLLSANAYRIDENGNRIGEVVYPTDWEETQKMILHTNPFCHPAILFRNEGYKYRQKMYYAEDYDLYLRMFSDGKKLMHRSDFLFEYRILENSLSRGNKSLIQALFKQKTIDFYHQRIEFGEDEYAKFQTLDYLEILNPDYKNTKEDLKRALKFAFISNWKEEYKLLLNKAIDFYGKKEFLNFWMIRNFYNFSQQVYKRL